MDAWTSIDSRPHSYQRAIGPRTELLLNTGEKGQSFYISALFPFRDLSHSTRPLGPTFPIMAGSSRPSVILAQGRLTGIQLKETFPQTVDAFLGIPYALPPVGERRFRPAEKVAVSTEKIDGSKYGPMAPGKALLTGGPKLEQDEDCLTANIFRPAGTTEMDKLPVALYIHGGAFNRGAAAMHNTGSMVAWSESPFIGVSFGYRVGALGFLPSSLSKKEGVLNLGLRDQIHLFEWVQENIGKFGGDPGNVTLFGLSAGAHSVYSPFTLLIIMN